MSHGERIISTGRSFQGLADALFQALRTVMFDRKQQKMIILITDVARIDDECEVTVECLIIHDEEEKPDVDMAADPAKEPEEEPVIGAFHKAERDLSREKEEQFAHLYVYLLSEMDTIAQRHDLDFKGQTNYELYFSQEAVSAMGWDAFSQKNDTGYRRYKSADPGMTPDLAA